MGEKHYTLEFPDGGYVLLHDSQEQIKRCLECTLPDYACRGIKHCTGKMPRTRGRKIGCQTAQVVAMIKQKMSRTEIADKLGISSKAISAIVFREVREGRLTKSEAEASKARPWNRRK